MLCPLASTCIFEGTRARISSEDMYHMQPETPNPCPNHKLEHQSLCCTVFHLNCLFAQNQEKQDVYAGPFRYHFTVIVRLMTVDTLCYTTATIKCKTTHTHRFLPPLTRSSKPQNFDPESHKDQDPKTPQNQILWNTLNGAFPTTLKSSCYMNFIRARTSPQN